MRYEMYGLESAGHFQFEKDTRGIPYFIKQTQYIDTELKGPHSLAVADLNGDGKPDVVTVAKDSRVAAWFENDGKGRFKKHEISGNQSSYDIRLVDMDGDGDLDLLVAGFESNSVVWYENRIRK